MSEHAFAMPPTSAPTLLRPGDPPAWTVERLQGKAPVLVVCDHASNAIPASLDALGLPAEALERHIAWDIGAAPLSRALAERLDAQLVLCGYSRLVVDCNRHPEDPTAFLAESDGQVVPGNAGLTSAARELRIEAVFRPYHDQIEARLGQIRADGVIPALVSVHSFTPRLNGTERPWHVGILWDADPRIPVPLLDALARYPELRVGDNEPYSGRHPSDYTIDRHAERAGLPHVCLEIRQDLLGDDRGVERWADILSDALRPTLADPALYRLREPPVGLTR
ncbi:MAG TPA: N-formylglutamate amidohydrolase [Steroidobacteraceae bacterium]|nr:N-formylglutamate amidohydrolase [Steroidobacteraceae bacterium]